MADHTPNVVAVANVAGSQTVVGYSLGMLPEHLPLVKDANGDKVLKPLHDLLITLQWKGRLLMDSKWMMGGQLCVARTFRKRGLAVKIYDLQSELGKAAGFSALVTEVDALNIPSLRAHERA